MKNYPKLIAEIKKIFPILENENFEAATDGTHYKVFLSGNYVVRFRDDNPQLLLREVDFLKRLNYPLVPKVVWQGEIEGSMAMVENRLPGKTINTVWKTLATEVQINIINQVVQFIQYLKSQTKDEVYSVNTGKKYGNYIELLKDDFEQKISEIKKFKQAEQILKDLLLIINNPDHNNLFISQEKITLVHGDLIIHNLLTDDNNLTGVLDWELAQFGDPDYDLFRLFYYQECAKAYEEQGTDESFEANYMDKLVTAISESKLIENIKVFQEKYKYLRAVFLLNALDWASKSENSDKNIEELATFWDKKSGTKYFHA